MTQGSKLLLAIGTMSLLLYVLGRKPEDLPYDNLGTTDKVPWPQNPINDQTWLRL